MPIRPSSLQTHKLRTLDLPRRAAANSYESWGKDEDGMMGQAPGRSVVHGEVERLKAHETRLRQKRIRLLRRELATTREAVETLERELRRLGDRETARSAGRIAWAKVYERLAETFTTKEMQELTGATPSLAGSMAFAWKKQGLIVAIRRGQYRKRRLPMARR